MSGGIDHITPTQGPHAGGNWVDVFGSGTVDFFGPYHFSMNGRLQAQLISSSFARVLTLPSYTPDPLPAQLGLVPDAGGSSVGQVPYHYRAAGDPLDSAIPRGRGRWRLTLHKRSFAQGERLNALILTELTQARSRRLEQEINKPSKLTFTLDGRNATTALVKELETDVVAWRWDEGVGADIPVFRGVVAQTEDILSEQSHVVNVTCHDYFAMLLRRYLTYALGFNDQTPQDTIVWELLRHASTVRTGGGARLPLTISYRYPDGTKNRPQGGTPRDRKYDAQACFGALIDDLAHVIYGFDYEVAPATTLHGDGSDDELRVFFPRKGIDRTEPLEYGKTITSLTRTVNSADYANYWRIIGSNETQDAPPIVAESAVPADADGTVVGTWMGADQATDVTVQATLQEKADGDLNLSSVLVPSYSLVLAPDVFRWDEINVGDTLPIIVDSGRLQVNSGLRVVARAFDVGDDGDENVAVTVGRPVRQLADLLTASAADISALARR